MGKPDFHNRSLAWIAFLGALAGMAISPVILVILKACSLWTAP